MKWEVMMNIIVPTLTLLLLVSTLKLLVPTITLLYYYY
jgi:hypothetical protein